MKSKYLLFGSVLSLGLAITGCSKEPIDNLTQEESRIYITNHDSSAKFSSYNTFSISDSVVSLNNGRSTKVLTAVDQNFINATRAQMVAAGYTEVNRQNKPDVGVNVTRIINTSTGVLAYDNFYGGYGGYYDPFYWGNGFGGFGYFSPYSYGTYSISEGALSVDILDLKNARTNNNINIIWSGLIRGSGIFNSDASAQVKTLFDQSPYLSTN